MIIPQKYMPDSVLLGGNDCEKDHPFLSGPCEEYHFRLLLANVKETALGSFGLKYSRHRGQHSSLEGTTGWGDS